MVEEMLAMRGIDVTHETIRQWAEKFGRNFAASIRRHAPTRSDKWRLDEVVVTGTGKKHWLWRAVDQDGFVLNVLIRRRRDRKAAKRLMRKLLRKMARVPRVMITDKLLSYSAARKDMGLKVEHRQHKGLNSRAENSRQPTNRRDRRSDFYPVTINAPIFSTCPIRNIKPHTPAALIARRLSPRGARFPACAKPHKRPRNQTPLCRPHSVKLTVPRRQPPQAALIVLQTRTRLTASSTRNIIQIDLRKHDAGGRHQIGTRAGFILECMAGFIGIRRPSHEGLIVSAIFRICLSLKRDRRFAQVVSVLFLALTFVGSAGSALAEKRVALVIGNSAYNNVSKLPNPANDAEAVEILFKSAGFDVVEQRQNLGNAEMRRLIRDFSEKAQGADLAVVFFAGHGIEVDGVNYLIPTDSRLERDLDVEDEAVSLDRVLKMIEPAKRLRLVILDACRDNPFRKSMKRTIATRSIGRGLGPVEPSTSDTLIAFAAKAGSTATDGTGPNSPFTTALLKHLVTPGLDVRLALGQVRDDVLRATESKQEPFVYGSLGGSTVTLTKDEQATQQHDDPNADIARDYDSAAKVGTREAWDAFLAAHPVGFYADLARLQRARFLASSPSSKSNTRSKAAPLAVEHVPAKRTKPGLSTKSDKRIPTPAPNVSRIWAKYCANVSSSVRKWRAMGVGEDHPGMISSISAYRQHCGRSL